MRGEILIYDIPSATGTISGDDSLRYSFTRADVHGGAELRDGARVDFVPQGEQATQIVVLADVAASPYGHSGHSPIPTEDPYDFKTAMISFNGRLRRKHFWISWAILAVPGIIFSFFQNLSFFLGLILLIFHLAIGFKRLHDMGKPGWLVAIPWGLWYGSLGMLVSAFGWSVITDPNALQAVDPETLIATGAGAFGFMFLAMLVSFVFLLWIGIADSQRGDNKYGPNPKGE